METRYAYQHTSRIFFKTFTPFKLFASQKPRKQATYEQRTGGQNGVAAVNQRPACCGPFHDTAVPLYGHAAGRTRCGRAHVSRGRCNPLYHGRTRARTHTHTHTHARTHARTHAHALPFPFLFLLRAAPLRQPRARGRECTSSLIPLPLHPVLLASATHARADAHARAPLSPSPFTPVARLTVTPRAYARPLVLPLPLHPRAEPVRHPGFGGEPFWCSLLRKGFS